MVLIDDLRYSVRALARSRLFSTAVVLTLAVGIGANIAVFSVVDALILRSLPYRDPNTLLALGYRSAQDASEALVPSPVFLAWQESSKTIESMTAFSTGEMGWLLRTGEPVRVSVAFLGSNFFGVLGVVGAQHGRPLQPSDEGLGASDVAVISDRLWKARFGGSSDVLGQTVRLNGRPFVVVGVAPADFHFPDAVAPDVLLPLRLRTNRSVVRFVKVIGRLRAAESIYSAQLELLALTRSAAPTFPPAVVSLMARGASVDVVRLPQRIVGDLRPVLLLALAAVAVILLTACANVAELLLARGMSRDREFSTRMAIGATPAQLARLILTETTLLALASGAATAALLHWSMDIFRKELAQIIPRAETISVDARLAGFLVVTVALTSLACAAGPLLRLNQSMRTTGRISTVQSGSDHGIRQWFVVGQVSMSFVLLLTGLLLLRTLWQLEGAHVGFDPTNVWTFRVPAISLRPPIADTQQRILDRIGQLSGVVSVGASTAFPLDGHAFGFTIPVADQPPPPVDARDATRVDAVSTGYFRTMRVRLVEGRDFDEHDVASGAAVAIVNEAFVRSILVGGRALGRQIGLGGGPQDATISIVGVIENVKDGSPAIPPKPSSIVRLPKPRRRWDGRPRTWSSGRYRSRPPWRVLPETRCVRSRRRRRFTTRCPWTAGSLK